MPIRKSILSLYKALIALRRKLPELVTGAYEPVAAEGDLCSIGATPTARR